jgi:hypothetical protein
MAKSWINDDPILKKVWEVKRTIDALCEALPHRTSSTG